MEDILSLIISKFLSDTAAGKLSLCSSGWRALVHRKSPAFANLTFETFMSDSPNIELCLSYNTIRPTKLRIRLPVINANAVERFILAQENCHSLESLEIIAPYNTGSEEVFFHPDAERGNFSTSTLIRIVQRVGHSLRALRIQCRSRPSAEMSQLIRAVCENCSQLDKLHLINSAGLTTELVSLIANNLTRVQELTLPGNDVVVNYSDLWKLPRLQFLGITDENVYRVYKPSYGRHPAKLRAEMLDALASCALMPPASSRIHPGCIHLVSQGRNEVHYLAIASSMLDYRSNSNTMYQCLLNEAASAQSLQIHHPWDSIVPRAPEPKDIHFFRAIAALPDGIEFLLNGAILSSSDMFHTWTCFERALLSCDDPNEVEVVEFLLELMHQNPDQLHKSLAGRHNCLRFCNLETAQWLLDNYSDMLASLLHKNDEDSGISARRKVVSATGPFGLTVLHEVALLEKADVEYLRFLVAEGANPNQADLVGRLPITYCIHPYNISISRDKRECIITYDEKPELDDDEGEPNLQTDQSRRDCAVFFLQLTSDSALGDLLEEDISTMLCKAIRLGYKFFWTLIHRLHSACRPQQPFGEYLVDICTIESPLYPVLDGYAALQTFRTNFISQAVILGQAGLISTILGLHVAGKCSQASYRRFAVASMEAMVVVMMNSWAKRKSVFDVEIELNDAEDIFALNHASSIAMHAIEEASKNDPSAREEILLAPVTVVEWKRQSKRHYRSLFQQSKSWLVASVELFFAWLRLQVRSPLMLETIVATTQKFGTMQSMPFGKCRSSDIANLHRKASRFDALPDLPESAIRLKEEILARLSQLA